MMKYFNRLSVVVAFLVYTSTSYSAGVPLFDPATSMVITKNNISLDIGKPVSLVSVTSTCHYFGKTTVGEKGVTSIRIDKRSCDGVVSDIESELIPISSELKIGDVLNIPLDGLADRIVDRVEKYNDIIADK